MGKEAASVKLVLSELANDGTARLRIHFPEKTIAEPGKNATIDETKATPTLSVSADVLKSASGKYIAVSIDLDAPFPSFSVLGPILHWLDADVTAGAVDADGWAPLVSAAEPAVVFYAGPGPPKPSAAHRYVFMVWEQPEGVSSETIRSTLGLAKEVGLTARMRWDQEAFEKKFALGPCLAANYFLTKG